MIPKASSKTSAISSGKSLYKQTGDFVETTITIPPDGGWGWIIVVASFFCNFVADGALYTFGIFLDDIGETFNTEATTVSIGSSLITGFYYFSGPVTCALVNRLGFQVTGFLGGIVASIAFLTSSMTTSIGMFLGLYGVVGGFGFGLVFVPSVVVIGFYFERWRALATSIAVSGSAIGILGFPLIVQGILGKYSWQIKFKAISGLCVIIACMALLYRPIKPVQVLTKDKKIVQVLTEDSIGSFHKDDKSGGIRNLFRRLRTTSVPSQAPGDSVIIEMDGLSTSSVFMTSVPEASVSTFFKQTPSKFDNKLSKLSTVYENANEKCSCRKCWDLVCCQYKCCRWCCGATRTNRPLYRDDIFYGASLYTLPGYSGTKSLSHTSKIKNMEYTMSVTRTEMLKNEEEVRSRYCPESVMNILKTMLNLQLLKSPSFLLLGLGSIITLLGMYIPFIFLMEWASEKNIDRSISINFYTALGLSNAIGRILSGIVSTFPNVKAIYVSSLSLMICGLTTISSYFLVDVSWHFLYISVFGLTIASFPSLKTPIVVDLVGLENLTNAFGLLLLLQGFAGFIGMPLAAEVVTLTHSYNTCFIFAGCYITLGGLLLIPVKLISDYEKSRKGNVQ